MQQFRYGKQAPVRFKDAITLHDVQAAPLPKATKVFGYGNAFKSGFGDDIGYWDMLGNDQYGDCAWAGPAHETMTFAYIAGHKAQFTRECVLADYSAGTGFDPNDPATDQGSQVVDVYDYRRTTGILDAAGKRHRILLGVRLPVNDWATFVNAIYTFGAVGIGFAVPQSAETQFQNHQPWSYVGDRRIIGGHYVSGVGSMNSDSECTLITWGSRQVMHRDFFEAYVDELWLPLSDEQKRAGNKGLHNIDWAKVVAMAEAL